MAAARSRTSARLSKPREPRQDLADGGLHVVAPDSKKKDVFRMRKPLRCRLGIHAWETRENPETRERYEVCIRCDTYRDPGQAAPGAGAAGVTGMGFG